MFNHIRVTGHDVALVCCAVLASLPYPTVAIKDGQDVAMCDYPGVAALTAADTGAVICTGVFTTDHILSLPELCKSALTKQLKQSDVKIFYGDGTQSVSLEKGTDISSMFSIPNGILQLRLIKQTRRGQCVDNAHQYSAGQDVVTSSCQLVGFGDDHRATKIYDDANVGFKAAAVTKSTGAGCCKVLRKTIPNWEQWVTTDTATFNCLTSSGAACGVSDVGAPIYCDRAFGEGKVVIGLTATALCESGEPFLVHDLTGDSKDVKFGVN